jgi:hypothetical protein
MTPPTVDPTAGSVFPPLTALPLADAAGAPIQDTKTCANCLAPLGGRFCGECGAPALDERPLTVGRFAADLVNEVTSMDSFTMRTLHSLFVRPGELTRDYLAGKTRWYLSPLRLYLLLFAVYICGSALLPDQEETYERVRIATTLKMAQQRRDVVAAVAASGAAPSRRDRALLDLDPNGVAEQSVRALRFITESQWVQVINAFAWAAVLSLLFQRRRRSYAEHLVFALHLLAFNLLVSLGNAALRALLHTGAPTSFDAISALHWVAIGSYFYFASRRLYAESRPRAAVKSVAFVAGAQACMILISTTAFMYAGFSQASSRKHPAARPLATAPSAATTAAPH